MTDATQKKFNRCIRKLARLMQAEVDKGLGVKRPKVPPKQRRKPTKWVSAFVDVRWFIGTKNYKAKFRVALPSGGLFCLVAVSSDMNDILEQIWESRIQSVATEWYGLTVHVTYDGEVSTDLNADPNCVVDPRWYES